MTADRVSVDLSGLDALASNLASIRSTMNATRSTLGYYHGQLGSAEIESALDDFEHDWSDGRRKIDENANKLATMASESARVLRQVDADLTTNLTTDPIRAPHPTDEGVRES